MTDQEKKAMKIVKDLMDRRFWGKLEFTFRQGEITFVRRVETERFNSSLFDAKGLDSKRD